MFSARFVPLLSTLLASLMVNGCQSLADPGSVFFESDLALLRQVNAEVNRQHAPCSADVCLDQWPDPADLTELDAWDCKAYAVAKADQLIAHHGFSPARLEYIVVEGPPLRVTHAALLVDGRWVLDSGLLCQVCKLRQFAAGLRLTGRVPVTELPYLHWLQQIAP